MKKICYRCDAKNDMYATVCQNCGYDLYEEIKNKTNIPNKKSKKSLVCYLMFGLILPLIMVSSYFVCFYMFLYGFENYNSEVYLNNYIDLIKSDNYEEIMKYNNIKIDKFNTTKEFAMYLDREYGQNREKAVAMKDVTQSTDSMDLYKVQFDGKKIKEFRVNKTDIKKLNYFNTWLVDKPEQNIYSESVQIYAPVGVDVYLNDSLITEDYIMGDKDKPLSYYSGIKDENYKHPKFICYEINNLMAISSVYAKLKDGEMCNIEMEDGVYNVVANMPTENINELKPLAEEFAKKYSAFIAQDYKFSELTQYIYKNTEFYKTLKEFYNGWFPEHSAYGYENVAFDKMLLYDENHASMQIKFNFYITYGNNKKKDYPVAYEIYFAKIDGKWLVANVKNF